MRLRFVAVWILVVASASVSARAELRKDIEFSRPGGVPLLLDAWVPGGEGPFPAVIVVHGGGFTAGDKQISWVQPLFDPLTRAGFVWFTINYRLAPQHPFPAAIDDVESAVRFVKSRAREFKVDPARVALVGESAGGLLVSYAGVRGRGSARVAGVVSLYGAQDLVARTRVQGKLSDALKAFLGISELNADATRKMQQASPITHVTKGMPPFLLIHGTRDPLVPFDQSVVFCETLRRAGNRCELMAVEGAGHGVEGWEKNPEFRKYKVVMVEWLKGVFAPGGSGDPPSTGAEQHRKGCGVREIRNPADSTAEQFSVIESELTVGQTMRPISVRFILKMHGDGAAGGVASVRVAPVNGQAMMEAHLALLEVCRRLDDRIAS